MLPNRKADVQAIICYFSLFWVISAEKLARFEVDRWEG